MKLVFQECDGMLHDVLQVKADKGIVAQVSFGQSREDNYSAQWLTVDGQDYAPTDDVIHGLYLRFYGEAFLSFADIIREAETAWESIKKDMR